MSNSHRNNPKLQPQRQPIIPGWVEKFKLAWWVLVLVCLFGWQVGSVRAQPLAATLLIQPPEIGDFPTMQVDFKLLDSAGVPVRDLELEQISVYEDQQAVQVESLDQEYKGVHFTLTVNASRELALRDVNGVSRYEKILGILESWATKRDSTSVDTMSLVTHTGVQLRHTLSSARWTEALQSYQPDFRNLNPDLQSFALALKFASERVEYFGVDQVLLYITPPPSPDQISPLNELTATAQAAGVHVNVWMVGDEYFLHNDQGKSLFNLAAATGGSFFHFTGQETIPDPEAYLLNLGWVYSLRYQSAVHEKGTHDLEIRVTWNDNEVRGESQPFYLEIEPPNPVFVNPPITVSYQKGPQTGASLSLPASHVQNLEIMIEFPDEHPRALTVSRLYVDGKLVSQNQAPPFDSFTWDLADYEENGVHKIQVIVVDELGLKGSTIALPVQVEVRKSETSPTQIIRPRTALTIAALVLGVAIFSLLAWLILRVLRSLQVKRVRERFFRHATGTESNPISSRVIAHLIPITAVGDRMETCPIQARTVIVGGNPQKASLVLDSPTVEAQHARLVQRDGGFWLSDLGTTHGTWVNYSRIGSEPVRIQPGDLLHFGRLGFRFKRESNSAEANLNAVHFELN